MSAPRFETFGCRLNAYETEAMKDLAGEAENTTVINTCAVTAEAVRQARQRIRRIARENPDAKIVVTGCAAQTEGKTFEAMPEVSHVLGNREKMDPATWAKLGQQRTHISDIMAAKREHGHLIDGFGTRARAYVQVQNGCDHRCTFCIIPYGRGNSRSVPAQTVTEQIKRLVGKGYNEVVLTGVDLTSWGPDIGTKPLGHLVQTILSDVPDLPRLRISSIDSIEADPALIDAITGEPRLMPHLHLSLQHGHPMILKRMKRRHTPQQALDFCHLVRKARPEIALGADLIAGFPTETSEMHAASLQLLGEAPITYAHIFPFSPREGTPAARMPQLPREIVKDRAQALRTEAATLQSTWMQARIGEKHNVLMEAPRKGRTPSFAQVEFEADQPRWARSSKPGLPAATAKAFRPTRSKNPRLNPFREHREPPSPESRPSGRRGSDRPSRRTRGAPV